MVPTPTFSKVEKILASWTDIDPVSPELYAVVNLVGLISLSTS